MKTFHQFTIRVFQSWFEILNRLAASGDSLQEIYCDCMYIMYIRRLSMYTLTQEKNARLWYYVYLHLFAFCLYCYLSLFHIFLVVVCPAARGHSPDEFHGLRNDHRPYFLLFLLCFFCCCCMYLSFKHSVLPFFSSVV